MSPPQTIAAFFDMDGTLLPYPSLEWRFIRYLLQRKALGASNAAKWLVRAARLFSRGPRAAMEANKLYLAGISRSFASDWANQIVSNCSQRLQIFEEGKDRIAWHQSHGHKVFLVSGTLAPLANVVAELLPGTVEALATELATELATGSPNNDQNSAIWTGALAGAHMVGEAKRDCLLTLTKKHDLNLSVSYAYGDSIADCAMLECVGHPEAVNPSWSLGHVARKRGWALSRWRVTAAARAKRRGPFDVVSTAPGVTATGKSR
jgi:HAD superfamily hydrolase (TIGR01490 family)